MTVPFIDIWYVCGLINFAGRWLTASSLAGPFLLVLEGCQSLDCFLRLVIIRLLIINALTVPKSPSFAYTKRRLTHIFIALHEAHVTALIGWSQRSKVFYGHCVFIGKAAMCHIQRMLSFSVFVTPYHNDIIRLLPYRNTSSWPSDTKTLSTSFWPFNAKEKKWRWNQVFVSRVI